jgi:hypothetical protein
MKYNIPTCTLNLRQDAMQVLSKHFKLARKLASYFSLARERVKMHQIVKNGNEKEQILRSKYDGLSRGIKDDFS